MSSQGISNLPLIIFLEAPLEIFNITIFTTFQYENSDE